MTRLDRMLMISSLAAIVLVTLHLAEDTMRRPGSVSYPASLLILATWLYGSLMLVGRRAGYVVGLLGAILASGVPLVHVMGSGGLTGGGWSGMAAFLSICGSLALGLVGALTFVLAAQGLWRSTRRHPSPVGQDAQHP